MFKIPKLDIRNIIKYYAPKNNSQQLGAIDQVFFHLLMRPTKEDEFGDPVQPDELSIELNIPEKLADELWSYWELGLHHPSHPVLEEKYPEMINEGLSLIERIIKKTTNNNAKQQLKAFHTKAIKEVKPEKKSPSIPKELEPLAREARKYETAEEFAENMFLFGYIKQSPMYDHYKSLADISKSDIDLYKKRLKKDIKKYGIEDIGRQIRNYAHFYKTEVPDILTRPAQLKNFYTQVIKETKPDKEANKIKDDIYDLVASGDVDDSIIEAMETINDRDKLIELIEKHII